MLSEHQPDIVGYCECGAELIDCEDWDKAEWFNGDPDCLHTLEPEYMPDREVPDETERWSFIKGYFPEYAVSNFGRVKRAFYTNRRKPNYILTPYKTPDGYLRVDLHLPGVKKRSSKLVHRLVIETFLGDPPEGHECNHKDGNKENNNVNNLEWVTKSENIKHAWSLGLNTPNLGRKNGRSKLRNGEVWLIRKLLFHKISQKNISKIFKISKQTISNISLNLNWKHIQYP